MFQVASDTFGSVDHPVFLGVGAGERLLCSDFLRDTNGFWTYWTCTVAAAPPQTLSCVTTLLH